MSALRFASTFLLGLLLANSLLACRHEGSKSNVLGEACPEMLLEEKWVQGEPITPERMKGKVLLFLFYQRECEGCERQAMPRIQKLHEKYIDHACALVFVVNTAFDKDLYPYLADIEETRKHLVRMDWTMPVARDLDEQSNELFTIDKQSGTPQAVVVNEHGQVCAHDWYSEEKEMDAVDAVFERLAAGLNCHCVRMPRKVGQNCQRAWDAIEAGDYKSAFDHADTIARSYGYDEADKADADYLKTWIEEQAKGQIDRLDQQFKTDPEAAVEGVDEVVKRFEGVTGVKDFAKRAEGWRDSPVLADFRKHRKELEKVEADISAGEINDERRRVLVERLKDISDRAGETVVGSNARKQLEKLTGSNREQAATDQQQAKAADPANGTDRPNKVSGSRINQPGSDRSNPGSDSSQPNRNRKVRSRR